MKSQSIAIAIAVLATCASVAHATDRCTDAQWREAHSNAPSRDGSVLVAKAALQKWSPLTLVVDVYDAQQEGYPLVCERRYTLPALTEASLASQRHPKR